MNAIHCFRVKEARKGLELSVRANATRNSKWVTRNKQILIISFTFLRIPIYMEYIKLYTNGFNGHLNPFVSACGSTRACTRMSG